MSEQAKGKLRDMRRLLQIEHKVFARLALGKDDVLVDWIPYAATDGKRHYWNPGFVVKTPISELIGVKVHESLHDRCGHSVRRGAIDPDDWNLDCDYAINPIVLLDAKLSLPGFVCYDPKFAGLSAEKVHAIRSREEPEEPKEPEEPENGQAENESPDQNDSDATGDESDAGASGTSDNDESPTGDGDAPQDSENGQDDAGQSENGAASGPMAPDGRYIPQAIGGVMDWRNDDGSEPTPDDIAAIDRENRKALEDAVRIGRQAGCLPTGFEAYVAAATESRVDWRDALQQFATELTRSDWSYKRPHAGQLVINGIYAPSLSRPGLGPLVFASDASGSVGNREFSLCTGEIATVHATFQPAEMYILQFDSDIQHAACYGPGDDISESINNRKGYGGTYFQPVFDWIEAQGIEPCGVVILTDLGNADRQLIDPGYPVLWISVDPRMPSPAFGQRVDML
jgi:predicted metal-dependent peptidase